MSALPPITDAGRHIQVSIWLSVYECTLDALRATSKALKALYGALSDATKETANQLIRSSTGMM
jgi:hypothetical protein